MANLLPSTDVRDTRGSAPPAEGNVRNTDKRPKEPSASPPEGGQVASAVLLEYLGRQAYCPALKYRKTNHQRYLPHHRQKVAKCLPHHRQKVAKWLHQCCLKTTDGRPKCQALITRSTRQATKGTFRITARRWPSGCSSAACRLGMATYCPALMYHARGSAPQRKEMYVRKPIKPGGDQPQGDMGVMYPHLDIHPLLNPCTSLDGNDL